MKVPDPLERDLKDVRRYESRALAAAEASLNESEPTVKKSPCEETKGTGSRL